jgi:hypothetical protein
LSSKTQAAFDAFESDYISTIMTNEAARAEYEAKLINLATIRDTASEAYDAAIAAINVATNAAAVKEAEKAASDAWSDYVKALGDILESKFEKDKLAYRGVDDAGVKYTEAISLKDSTLGGITTANSGFQVIADNLSAAKAFHDAQTVVA